MNNLSVNLKNTKICEVCKERFEYNPNCKNLPKYCEDCAKKTDNEKAKKRAKLLYLKEKNIES